MLCHLNLYIVSVMNGTQPIRGQESLYNYIKYTILRLGSGVRASYGHGLGMHMLEKHSLKSVLLQGEAISF